VFFLLSVIVTWEMHGLLRLVWCYRQFLLDPGKLCDTVEVAYYNRGCYQSAIVIEVSGPKTLHLKTIKNKPFIINNLLVIFIKLQIIRVHM
jgi:hypothetical protein